MPTTLEALETDRTAALARYREMLIELVETEFLPDDAEQIREAAGRSFDEMRRDAAKLQTRKQQVASLERADADADKIRDIEAEKQRLEGIYKEVFHRTEEERRQAAKPINDLKAEVQIRALRSQITSARSYARSSLEESASPEIDEQISALQGRMESLRQQHRDAVERAHGEIVGYVQSGQAKRADGDYLRREIAKAEHAIENASDDQERMFAESKLKSLQGSLEALNQARDDSLALMNAQHGVQQQIEQLLQSKYDWKNGAI